MRVALLVLLAAFACQSSDDRDESSSAAELSECSSIYECLVGTCLDDYLGLEAACSGPSPSACDAATQEMDECGIQCDAPWILYEPADPTSAVEYARMTLYRCASDGSSTLECEQAEADCASHPD